MPTAVPRRLRDCSRDRCEPRTICQIREEQDSLSPEPCCAVSKKYLELVLDQCRNDLQDIDGTISLFRDALALHPQRHPDHSLSLYNLTEALTWRHQKKHTAADIREAAQLYHELLPLCPEGTYLRSLAAGANGVDYVIRGCNDLPTDASDEGIHLRRIVLELCPPGHQLRPRALDELAQAVGARFDQHGSIDDLDTSIQLGREAVSLCPEGRSDCDYHVNNLAVSLVLRFDHQGKLNDLDEAISLHEETLRLRPVEHKYHDCSLDNLGLALIARFNKRGDIDDITRAISLYREALTLCPPGHPRRDTMLNNLASALKTRYDKLDASENLNEAKDLYRESLSTRENVDVEGAITICQESLAALSSLHPHRYFNHMRLQQAYMSRHRILHDLADLSVAIQNFRLASRHPIQGFPECIQEAIDRVHQAEFYHHEAVDSELELVHKLVPATANRTTISGDAATRAGALEGLQGSTWVHLACHGKQDPAQPYNSHFIMRDEHLTLLDIMDKDIPHAEFAFLSACHTAVGDEKTPDEVIHLAAGL
ncbi:hypothetical protein BDR05DRAFT_1058690, partial [Suillus weaverae]